MKFLIDESVEFAVIRFLRQIGHDVVAVSEGVIGIRDEEVLKAAYSEKRILVTNDKDFGTLIYFQRAKHHGVVLLRLPDEEVKQKINRIRVLLDEHAEELADAFVVVDKITVRIRRPL